MKQVSITEICEFQGGTQPPKKEWAVEPTEGYVRMLQIRDFTQGKKEHVAYVKHKPTLKTCTEQDILIGRYGASIGKIVTGLAGAYNVALIKTKPDTTKISRDYLLYLLKGNPFQNFIANVGSRAAQAGFNKTDLTKFKVPLPPLDIQKRIASILDAASELKQKDNALIAKYNELPQSLFLDMFGDPVKNDKGWDKETIGNLVENIDSGWSPKCESHAAQAAEWGVLKLGSVTYCSYNENENKALIQGTQPKESIEVQAGDILFSRKNTYELVAACAYVFQTRPHLMLSDLIFRLVPKENAEINSIFLWKLLTNNSQRRKIQSLAGGAAGSMPNISKSKLKSVKVPVPPIDLQNQFAERIQSIEKQKQQAQASLKKSEELFNCLLQKAFKGELVA